MAASDRLHYRVVAALIERDGRYLITQRRPEARMPLLWEFPGGRVEPGETDEQALARELHENLGLEAAVGERVLHVTHGYQGYDLDFLVYRCAPGPREAAALRVHDLRWVRAEDFEDYPFPGADQATVDALLEDMAER